MFKKRVCFDDINENGIVRLIDILLRSCNKDLVTKANLNKSDQKVRTNESNKNHDRLPFFTKLFKINLFEIKILSFIHLLLEEAIKATVSLTLA